MSMDLGRLNDDELNAAERAIDASAADVTAEALAAPGIGVAPASGVAEMIAAVAPVEAEQVMRSTPVSGGSAEPAQTVSKQYHAETPSSGRRSDRIMDPIRPASANADPGYHRATPSVHIDDMIRGSSLRKPGLYTAGLGANVLKASSNLEKGTAKIGDGTGADTRSLSGNGFRAAQSVQGALGASPKMTRQVAAAPAGPSGMGGSSGGARISTGDIERERKARAYQHRLPHESRVEATEANIEAEKKFAAAEDALKQNAPQDMPNMDTATLARAPAVTAPIAKNPFMIEPKMAMAPKGPRFDSNGNFVNKGDGDLYSA